MPRHAIALSVFAAMAVALLMTVDGRVTLADENEPPPVLPGYAQWNCERIVAAGYSPHDYVHVVTRSESVSYSVNYSHIRITVNSGQPDEVSFYQLMRWPVQFRPGMSFSFIPVISEYQPRWVGPGQSDFAYDSVGTLSDLSGGSLANHGTVAGPQGSGLNAYLWTPNGGGQPLIYRDYSVTYYDVETEWRHDPDWTGAEGARMSRIWASAEACAG